MLRVNEGLRTERLSGELVVLDADRGMVHRVSGDALAAYELIATGSPVPASLEDGAAHLVSIGLVVDETPTAVSRRWLVKAGTALSAGVVTMGLPRAVAASSGGATGYAEGDLGAAGAGVTAPTISSATPGDGSATVAWSAVSGATGYEVYYRATGESLYQLAGSPSAPTTSLSVAPLVNGTEYQFAVRAVDGVNKSALSATVTAIPEVGVAHPVTAATATLNSATVSLDNESGYSYSYAVGSGSSTTVTGQNSFTATGLSENTVEITVTKTKAGVSRQSRVTLARTTSSYTSTASVATFTVPANGPRRVKLTLRGGTGAKGFDFASTYKTGGAAGPPPIVIDYLTVAANDTMKFAVGAGASGSTGGTNPLGPGLFSGGSGGAATGISGAGGGGGGAASVVRHYVGTTTSSVVIAAGSGGGGGASLSSNGARPPLSVTWGFGWSRGDNGEDSGSYGGGGGGGGGGGWTGGAGGLKGMSGGKGGSAGTNRYSAAGFQQVAVTFTQGANGSISLEYYAVSITEL